MGIPTFLTVPSGYSKNDMPPKTIPFDQAPPKTVPFSSKPTATLAPPKQSLSQSIWSDISARGSNIVEEITKSGQNPLVSGVKATAQGFGAISDVAGDVVGAIPGSQKVIEPITSLLKKGFSKAVDYASPIGQKLYSLEQKEPQKAKIITDFLETASASGEIAGNILLAESLRVGANTASRYSQEAVKALTTKSEQQIENTILSSYEKGVKPALGGKSNPVQLRKYRSDVIEAAKVIDTNKVNLSFVDDLGDISQGQNPKTLQQLSDAVEQTKKIVFKQYDDLAKQAGDAGVQIDLKPIGSELDTIINSKALKISSPETINYAQGIKDRLLSTGNLDAVTTQEVIQNFNNALEAFYKNPSFETASRAQIAAMVANRMRVSLDEGISSLTGQSYQALKKTYGSFKSIEKDVLKAALREARKNSKGLIDFTDIFSGGQVISGILSMSPAQIAQGVVQKSIATFYKHLNDPNRAIQKMFNAVERLSQPR